MGGFDRGNSRGGESFESMYFRVILKPIFFQARSNAEPPPGRPLAGTRRPVTRVAQYLRAGYFVPRRGPRTGPERSLLTEL